MYVYACRSNTVGLSVAAPHDGHMLPTENLLPVNPFIGNVMLCLNNASMDQSGSHPHPHPEKKFNGDCCVTLMLDHMTLKSNQFSCPHVSNIW